MPKAASYRGSQKLPVHRSDNTYKLTKSNLILNALKKALVKYYKYIAYIVYKNSKDIICMVIMKMHYYISIS